MPSGKLPLAVRPAPLARLEATRVAQLFSCPSEVVLPSEEEVARCDQVGLVVEPHALGYVGDLSTPTELLQSLQDPVHQVRFAGHAPKLRGYSDTGQA